MTPKTLAAALLATAAAACTAEELTYDELAQAGGASGSGVRENQGRSALGSIADGLAGTSAYTYFSTSNVGTSGATQTTFGLLSTNSTCLTAVIGGVTRSCADAAFNNYVFPGPSGSNITLKILSSKTFTTAAPAHQVTGYRVQYSVNGGAYADYCRGSRLAFPIPGEVHKVGVLNQPSANPRMSWACSEYKWDTGLLETTDVSGNGVWAKATAWGYNASPLTSVVDNLPVATGLMLGTAVRMGRADYCYKGVSNSIDGTAVAILDYVTGNLIGEPGAADVIEPSPAASSALVDPTQYYFEAGWQLSTPVANVSGLPTYTDNGVPVCLSKLRWSTLPLGAICGGKIQDPRVNKDARFCEDLVATYGELGNYGQPNLPRVVLANASKFNDLGLRAWKNAADTDRYTTTRGSSDAPVGGAVPPAAGYTTIPSPLDATQTLLGTILTSTGKSVWVAAYGSSAGTMVALQTCTKGGDIVTTTTVPQGYACSPAEGYIWTTPPSSSVLSSLALTTRPLYRYLKTGGTDYYTTTATSVSGYGSQLLLGYILAPRVL